MTSNVGQKENPISVCVHCENLCDQYRNCKVKSCNERIFVCPKCQKDYHNCCSVGCKKELLK
jgi:predicted sulfurtransferase